MADRIYAAQGDPTMVSLEDMLKMLQTVGTSAVSMKTEANTAVSKDDFIGELSGDGINDERFDYREERHVTHVPALPATTPVAPIANVCHVPVSKAEPSSTFKANVNVVKNITLSDSAKRDTVGLERGANRDIRTEGNFAASVLATVGADDADATAAPIPGLLTRVAQAILCAETGAKAAVAPNSDSWDIRVVPLSASATFRNLYPSHAPVFLPRDLGKPASEALASLLLPGGAAAYGWRFRPGPVPDGAAAGPPDPRDGMMPSYARKLYPGGNDKILEAPEPGWIFAGAALTLDALAQLERWLRNKFGHDMMDAAFKTAAVMGHVYVEPGATADDLGNCFDVVQATTTHATVDLNGPNYS
jgi:hypothetical protein